MAERRLIGVDFDDVLIDFTAALIPYMNAKFGRAHTRSEMVNFELEKLWGCSREEAVELVHDFIEKTVIVAPVAGAIEGVKALAKDNDLILITGRAESTMTNVLEWLDAHIPGAIGQTYFTNQFRGEKKMSKAEFCIAAGVDVLIDDFKDTALACSLVGVPVLLFDTPWNQGEMPPSVTRVHSWEEIVGVIGQASTRKR